MAGVRELRALRRGGGLRTLDSEALFTLSRSIMSRSDSASEFSCV